MILRITFLILFCAHVAAPMFAEDKVGDALRKALSAAKTQTDLNICSRDLASHLDKQLTELERAIGLRLDAQVLRLFNDAAAFWRKYRAAQVACSAEQFEGGSIQPLVSNLTYIRITEERISELRRFRDPEKHGI